MRRPTRREIEGRLSPRTPCGPTSQAGRFAAALVPKHDYAHHCDAFDQLALGSGLVGDVTTTICASAVLGQDSILRLVDLASTESRHDFQARAPPGTRVVEPQARLILCACRRAGRDHHFGLIELARRSQESAYAIPTQSLVPQRGAACLRHRRLRHRAGPDQPSCHSDPCKLGRLVASNHAARAGDHHRQPARFERALRADDGADRRRARPAQGLVARRDAQRSARRLIELLRTECQSADHPRLRRRPDPDPEQLRRLLRRFQPELRSFGPDRPAGDRAPRGVARTRRPCCTAAARSAVW